MFLLRSEAGKKYCIDHWTERENYAEAIAVLEGSPELDKEYPGLINGYIERLKDLPTEKNYKKWASILKRMLSVQGGREYVQKIIEKWHEQYPKRKAVMEEIDKIKLGDF